MYLFYFGSLYCGSEARFDGLYAAKPAACGKAAAAAAEKRFQTAFRAKQYTAAAEIRQRYIADCKAFLDFTERMHAANGLAAAYQKAGDKAACRRALAAVRPWLAAGFDPGELYRADHKRETRTARSLLRQCR